MRIRTEPEVLRFFPSDLEVVNIRQSDSDILIKMFVRSQSCPCPKCGTVSMRKHGTYERKIQDLPISGKTTWLLINAYEYQCENPECTVTTFVETVHGFLNYYSRMTERCADFVCTLAMETSCEGCSRICKAMNLKISGDSVIRLITKRFQAQVNGECAGRIKIDDFAVKEWLSRNRHVKTITRERAAACALAIQKILPDAMQMTDWSYLHQNMLKSIQNVIHSMIPAETSLSKECDRCCQIEQVP